MIINQIKKMFNISNLLSFLRIFLAIPIYYLLATEQNMIALMVISAAFVTDFLDGYFARRLNQITEMGKVLDPFADKACTTAGFIALYLYQDFPLWLALVIILRDLIILLASLYFLNRKKIVLPSNRIGKITVFFITLYAIVYILNWHAVGQYLYYLVIPLILISMLNYAKVFFNELKTDHAGSVN